MASPRVRAQAQGAPFASAQWWWILHDDCAPEPECLSELVQAAAVGKTVGAVGVKQLSWDGQRLLELGIFATSSARRLERIGEEEIDAVAAVMRTGMIAQGPQVAAFEEEFAATLVPGTHAVAVNSGTSALHLGLLAAGIGPGDEVIVPSFTFAATANSVAITGETPVFAYIDPLTFLSHKHI